MQTPDSPPSPFRLAVDDLLSDLADGAIASLNPLERTGVAMQFRRRGWDLARLSRRGPLRDVSDAQLVVLLANVAERLDAIIVEHADALTAVPTPSLDESLAALSRSLSRA